MSESAASEKGSERLIDAKNIALGWRIVGQMPPQTLEEAIQMLRDSSAFAAKVCDLLSEELAERNGR
ncbi:hypothetical protein WB66_11775 [bacteria symbiont BFo1 of Frankliniella occidentalis]|uniref:hypothetical protein n=1 Tax=Erwinia aphidicola TaxID=68334 RepID=UPI000664633B|nr:hypothetical protein AI28_01110 [bacteria symbiont BFo1 of Frankliniella occidentalis]KYP84578.1 hypothetical protein WB66_11775 [bacteria symbiont BFo1 of Frankliniella occidentalis]KYP89818.1 hypothetical protein WB91_11565 [bacteria symbiont BFo1 of Frankliniella occidentalis]